MMRLNTSRPKRSVPSGCSQPPRSVHTGGISLRVMSPSVGLCGASTGARTAVSTSASNTAPENHGRRLKRSPPDPWIEIRVEHVHTEVAGAVERAQHQHAGLHDRIVAR